MNDFLDHPRAIRPGEELDLAKLEPYLRRYFPDATGALEVRQFPSGHYNLIYSLRLGAKELVLRRPPFGSKVKSAHDMSREFRVLSKLHSAYPPAPHALFYCDDDGIIGAPFYVMEPIRGVILRRNSPAGLDFSAEKARKLSESFIENLIRLHRVDYAAAGLADLGKPEGYLERQVRGWTERYYGSKTHDDPEVEKISSWMQQHMPTTSAVSLVHNDYKYDNVVLDSTDITRIVGVLDWEMCTIGDPLTDLGTALAYWVDSTDPEEVQQNRWGPTTEPGSFTRGEIVHYYAQKTRCDTSQIAFYLAFARFKLAVIVQQIYYRYQQGLTKDERFAAMPEKIQFLLRAALHGAQTGRI
jgi:aminoglycoside phosphotransferase (APT) family kinase protein